MNLVLKVRQLVDRYPVTLKLRQNAVVDAFWPRYVVWENRRKYRAALARLRSTETRRAPECRQIPGLLSFVSTVWNTDPEFLGILAESVCAQAGGTHFEWLVLDNGTTNVETRWLLAELGRLPFVRLGRVEQNLGIIGGMRWCLEHATGRYIMPLDSDDYLSSDCVLRVTEAILANEYPPLLYTDEDKLLGDHLQDAYHKPRWDPVLFSDSAYIAHLGVIERAFALELEAYTDPGTEGSHDWDTFTRFVNAGVEPVHVPHVVYSWRMHSMSTSAAIHSKPYVFDSQKNVLTRFLQGVVRPERFWLDKSPLFANTPDWCFRTTRGDPPAMQVVHVGNAARALPDTAGFPARSVGRVGEDAPVESLRDLLGAGEPEELVCLAWDQLSHDRNDWAWDAFTYLECFGDAVALGGPVYGADGRALCAGIVFGFGRGIDSPDRGRPRGDPGFFAQMWKHRSVAALTSQNLVLRRGFLASVLAHPKNAGFTVRMLGPVAGALAWQAGKRFIYSPFMSATAASDWEAGIPQADVERFLQAFGDVVPDNRFYSPKFSLATGQGYQVAGEAERQAHLARIRGRLAAAA
ncbi:MAG TPA: glycosyltransferase [Usitatibacter sp.]|nr:glycosyltransferase [Usitatibacter sp.]